MNPTEIVQVLEGTMNPNVRKQAEVKLDEMYKIAGFAPLLLQLVMSDEIQMAVRQSGAIYLKNMCTQSWHTRVDKDGTPITDVFSIHENDRSVIRENIVEAIIHAPDIIRNQLTVIVHKIIHLDYPEKWPGVVDKISIHLQSDNPRAWMGALLTLYQLVKNYEFKKTEERGPVIAAMKIFLPVMLQLFNKFISDNSASSVLLQKQLLKILYALIQYSLPIELFNEQTIDEWIKLMRIIIERPVPPDTLQVDELERPDLPWWKCKKWAMHFLARVFERYGSPGSVTKEYNEFSEFFLKRYSVAILQVILKVLDSYRKKEYCAPRVVQQALHFLDQAVSHAHTWKLMKDVYVDLLKDIIFPLMCFTDEDKEVWEDDPHEYIRMKFDVFEDFLSPASAAQCLLNSACSKRKQVLQKTMGFCYSILTETVPPNGDKARRKDGVLHIIGTLGDTLLKRKMYKDQLELMLKSHVIPELTSEHGYMRARACWVIQHFSEAKFKKKESIITICEALKHLLLSDRDLPVRVEAAISMEAFLQQQEIAEKHCVAYVSEIVQALLGLVHETENEDVTNVVQRVICLYCEQVIPYAVEITKNLTMTFLKVLESTNQEGENGTTEDDEYEDAANDKVVTAMGILTTIERVLEIMEEEREITVQLEGIVAPIVAHVLKNRMMNYYEDIFSLMYSLTCQAISPSMWEALPLISQVFEDDGFDFFTDMMPCLHSFCTIDTPTLLANPSYLEIIYKMCKQVLDKDAGEEAESHAAKLLEVIILQCRGSIDQCIPLFVEAALSRLTREVKTSELRTICLQVVVAALYYNPTLLLETLENIRFPNSAETISEQFFRQWLSDVDCFLGIHDRRVCILGLCTLMDLNNPPNCIGEMSGQIIPSLIMLFQGLQRAYKVRGEEERSDSSDSSDDEDDDDEIYERQELASDEDEIDEDSAEYLEMLKSKEDSEASSIYSDEETELESFASCLDESDNEVEEFTVFKKTMLVEEIQLVGNEEIMQTLPSVLRHQATEFAGEGDDAEESYIAEGGETMLEAFTSSLEEEDTSVDEFCAFKRVLCSLEARDPARYMNLTKMLSEEQRKNVQEIYVLADQRLAAAESRKIEKTGGYQFGTTNVPTTFNFSNARPPTLSP